MELYNNVIAPSLQGFPIYEDTQYYDMKPMIHPSISAIPQADSFTSI